MARPAARPRLLGAVLLLVLFLVFQGYLRGVYASHARDWNRDLRQAQADLATRQGDYDRFVTLTHAQLPALECRSYSEAEAYASEALRLAPQFERDWNYGNAIHNGHVVLGRLALLRGDVAAAGQELILAGKTPGSPQLDSFGPNMSLAKGLLEHGQRELVCQYFDECRVFWRSDYGALTRWRILARLHLPPDFGTNLVY